MDKKVEITLREYPEEEYLSDLKKLLKDKGLYLSVQFYADKIAEECRVQDKYRHFPTVAEWLIDILNLIKLAEEGAKSNGEN